MAKSLRIGMFPSSAAGHSLWVTTLVLGMAVTARGEPRDAQAVARSIDQQIDAKLQAARVKPSPASDDAEFQRRIYLDLTGRLPSLDKVAAFIDSTGPDKRARLIDELLASPEYGQHFARYWAELLIKRDGEVNSKMRPVEFRAWLAKEFNDGKGWDQIVTALLTVEGTGPAGFFFRANKLSGERPSPAKIVGTVGNLFLGIQLQCAQCHDHPFTSEWKHDDFWGMAAFFGRTHYQPFTGSREGKITESDPPPPDPTAKQKKVFQPPVGGKIEIPDPLDAKKTLREVPAKFLGGPAPELTEKGPYRPHFANWLTAPSNPWFARAAINRLWAVFFARGLINPLDDMGPKAVASHPELLNLLTKEFQESGHDYKHLIRAICNSNAYQRTSRTLPDNRDDENFSRMPVKLVQGEVLLKCLDQVLGVEPPVVPTRNKTKEPISVESNAELFDKAIYDEDPSNYTFGAPQLLRLMNAEVPRRSGAVIARLTQDQAEPGKVVERFYLLTLSRRPTADESKELLAFVKQAGEPAKGYAAVLWILLNSAEFVANH